MSKNLLESTKQRLVSWKCPSYMPHDAMYNSEKKKETNNSCINNIASPCFWCLKIESSYISSFFTSKKPWKVQSQIQGYGRYGSIPIDTFLVGWTSIYQLFWGSLGTRVLTHPHNPTKHQSSSHKDPFSFPSSDSGASAPFPREWAGNQQGWDLCPGRASLLGQQLPTSLWLPY